MNIDFDTLQDLTIPEGAVEMIQSGGKVIWKARSPVLLEVSKIISNTYAGETTYENEEFILLDIYPQRANRTVRVTYGGLTKTLSFTGTNAQQVFFGTFNGISDSMSTPASGTLKIEGGFEGFAIGSYNKASKTPTYCSCITAVTDMSSVKILPNNAFQNCDLLTSITIPNGVTSIGNSAFYGCDALTSVNFGRNNQLTSIGDYAFQNCYKLWTILSASRIEIPNGVTYIGTRAFYLSDVSKRNEYETLILPMSLLEIGSGAFAQQDTGSGYTNYFTTVANVIVFATTPPIMEVDTVVGGAFAGSVRGPEKITVPKGCGELYKAAEGWSIYADVIVEAE